MKREEGSEEGRKEEDESVERSWIMRTLMRGMESPEQRCLREAERLKKKEKEKEEL